MLDKFIESLKKAFASQSKPPSHQYGRHVLSSKPQSELETEAGEKLYKVAENSYVNQRVYDSLNAEHHPFVEFESLDSLKTLSYDFEQGICAVWHPIQSKLFVLSKTTSQNLMCLLFDATDTELVLDRTFEVSMPNDYDNVESVSHHPELPYLLIVCTKHLVVFDYKAKEIVSQIDTQQPKLKSGGFYPNLTQAWTLVVNKYRSGFDWLIWDYAANTSQVFELERFDHYGRGATLHPSGLLIGAAWNAYCSGYLIHKAQPESENLFYYSKPAPERNEYESYNICFSNEGTLIAFFANPFLGGYKNYSKICVYDVESANLLVEFYTGTQLYETFLQFANQDRRLGFCDEKTNTAHIFNSKTGKKVSTLKSKVPINDFTCHKLFGYYAVLHQGGITLYVENTLDGTSTTESALDFSERFIAANAQHLKKVGEEE